MRREIHASDLRAMGIEVPLSIPDCAWIPAGSLEVEVGKIRADGDEIRGIFKINQAEPWRWVEAVVPPPMKYPEIEVNLSEAGGNAAKLVGAVMSALNRGGASSEEIEAFQGEATSGDYDNVLQICLRWVRGV